MKKLLTLYRCTERITITPCDIMTTFVTIIFLEKTDPYVIIIPWVVHLYVDIIHKL